MSVVIIVLKIIGGVLLFLLGFLLLALCLVFFVPVRYRVLAKLLEGQEAQLRVQVSWLLHLVTFFFVQEEGESRSSIRIFGIRLKPKKEKKKKSKERNNEQQASRATLMSKKRAAKEEARTEAERENETEAEPTDREETLWESTREETTKPFAEDEPKKTERLGKAAFFERQKALGEAEPTDREETLWESTREETTKPFAEDEPKKTERLGKAAFFERQKALGRRLKTLCGQLGTWKERLFREENKSVVLAVLAELKYLLGHFKFRKLIADIQFCAGDPAATGQALGVLSMLPFLYGKQVAVFPDFEGDEAYVRGEVSFKGRMRVIHFAASLVRLWKEKEVRGFIRELLG